MQQYTSTITASVSGNVTGVSLAPGTVFDADMVVGHHDGAPLTLGEALGRDLLSVCTPVTSAAVDDNKPRGIRRAPSVPVDPPADDPKE